MELYEIIAKTKNLGGADIYIVPDTPLMLKRCGRFEKLSEMPLTAADAEILIREIYGLNDNRPIDDLLYSGDDDFSFTIHGVGRIRCCAYRQNGGIAAVLRLVSFAVPDPVKLGIPEDALRLADMRKGLILVTGPAGCGKSTTISCMLDRINRTRSCHIMTIEDPIEFIHRPVRSIISQREVRTDVESFSSALRSAMRQNTDVIMLSELPDPQSVLLAVTAAEFGRLVIAGAHSFSVAGLITCMSDVVPAEQQAAQRAWLSSALVGIVAQQLLPTVDGGVEPVFDVLKMDKHMSAAIRRGDAVDGRVSGMDERIIGMLRAGRITRETALAYAIDPRVVEEEI